MERKFFERDEAVSAVVGVLLMVAITVILAALIASYVLHLGDNVEKPKTIGVDVRRTTVTGVIAVVTLSGTDLGSLKSGGTGNTDPAEATYTLVADGMTIPPCNSAGAPLIPGDKYNANTAGSIMYFGMIPANAEVTVVVHYVDGTTSASWSGNLP